jgi:hypothetical protein
MQASEQLFKDGIINQEQLEKITTHETTKPMSLHWELRTILYLGVLLFTSGIGILIYKNIDTIGHQAILGLILACTAACFYYAHKLRLPYSNQEVKHTSPFFDYVILLGCLLFSIFIGYLQFQYTVFGLHYGFATLLPTLVFFACAYVFDHKGLLSLGISGLAAWAGFTVTPFQLLVANDFSSTAIIFTAIILGLLLVGVAYLSAVKSIKKHFAHTYNQFAINMLCIATLAALFQFDLKIISLLGLLGVCFYYFKHAVSRQSFLFLLLSILYSYIGITYLFFYAISNTDFNEGVFMFGLLYIIASCLGVVSFFLFYKRILKLK